MRFPVQAMSTEYEPETVEERRTIDQLLQDSEEDQEDADKSDDMFVPEGSEDRGVVDEGVEEVSDDDEDPEVSTATDVDVEQLSWIDRSQLAMDLIMHNVSSAEQTWKNQDKRCPFCIQDPTMPQPAKDKEWNKKDELKRHMQGEEHSRYSHIRRQLVAYHKEHDVAHGNWSCKYCSPGTKSYQELAKLIKHIEESTAATDGDEHEKLKTADGWYKTDFYGEHSDEYKSEVRRNVKTRLSNLGILEDPPELPHAIPHPTRPGIMLGPNPFHISDSILAEGVITLGPMPTPETFEKDLEALKANVKSRIDSGAISFGPMPDASWTPPPLGPRTSVPSRLDLVLVL